MFFYYVVVVSINRNVFLPLCEQFAGGKKNKKQNFFMHITFTYQCKVVCLHWKFKGVLVYWAYCVNVTAYVHDRIQSVGLIFVLANRATNIQRVNTKIQNLSVVECHLVHLLKFCTWVKYKYLQTVQLFPCYATLYLYFTTFQRVILYLLPKDIYVIHIVP